MIDKALDDLINMSDEEFEEKIKSDPSFKKAGEMAKQAYKNALKITEGKNDR